MFQAFSRSPPIYWLPMLVPESSQPLKSLDAFSVSSNLQCCKQLSFQMGAELGVTSLANGLLYKVHSMHSKCLSLLFPRYRIMHRELSHLCTVWGMSRRRHIALNNFCSWLVGAMRREGTSNIWRRPTCEADHDAQSEKIKSKDLNLLLFSFIFP